MGKSFSTVDKLVGGPNRQHKPLARDTDLPEVGAMRKRAVSRKPGKSDGRRFGPFRARNPTRSIDFPCAKPVVQFLVNTIVRVWVQTAQLSTPALVPGIMWD